jgi:hypothetical protein
MAYAALFISAQKAATGFAARSTNAIGVWLRLTQIPVIYRIASIANGQLIIKTNCPA